jgi:hypothetical protein
MLANNTPPTILIRENTLMPEGLAVESEIFFKGWRIIKNLDRSAFTRKIEVANWYFSYLAGGIKANVLASRLAYSHFSRVPQSDSAFIGIWVAPGASAPAVTGAFRAA